MAILGHFTRFIKFYTKARTEHDVHSPFLHRFILNVLDSSKIYYRYGEIENLRKQLMSSREEIEFIDHGAGSMIDNNSRRSVKSIVKNSATSCHDGKVLFNLVNHFKPNTILELGTSLGIGTAYLAAANSKTNVISIEGNPSSAIIAKQYFASLKLNNIKVCEGVFDKVLPKILKANLKLDMVFLDGNHQREATLSYFELLLPYFSEKAIIILDDIYWSDGMIEAFEILKQRKEVTLSIDIFSKGILFLNPELKDINDLTFITRKYKPWRLGIWGTSLL